MSDKLKAEVTKILGHMAEVRRDKNGYFEYEIYADYRDRMDAKTAIEILGAEDPEQAFWEKLDEWYMEYEAELRGDLEEKVEERLTDEDGPYPNGLLHSDGDLHDLLLDMVYFTLPGCHYLGQGFPVNIMVDTGDGNYDYTLNNLYPAYCGYYNEGGIDSKASVAWLAKTQGYTKGTLRKALNEGDMRDPKGFLQSMRVEVANIASHMNTLTFLVELTLEQLIELNRLVRLQDRNGHFYDATKNPYCGYIVIDKKTMTGLYDPWSGGGSCFEIELEKDVKLPIRFIRSALPDGGDGYSVGDVYGMCYSAWTQGGVKLIHAPTEETLKKEKKTA